MAVGLVVGELRLYFNSTKVQFGSLYDIESKLNSHAFQFH